MTEWFKNWFGEDYLALYPHRNEAEARQAVALLATRGAVPWGGTVLDLACGAGRHAAALQQSGARVVGLDLSAVLLREARSCCNASAGLVRGDMRYLPFRDGSFGAVVNLFTSFGYFSSDEEHQQVLTEVARILKPGGRFTLDFLNAPAVRATLVPRDEREVRGRKVVQERRVSEGGRSVIKNISLEHEERSFMERVRLFERAELEQMLRGAGLVVDEALGDYAGGPHTDTSPRLLLLAHRA